MGTFRHFVSASFGLFLLIQCNTKQTSESDTQMLSPSTKTLSNNLLTGEWKYINSIWYTSELTLQDNGTFEFHDQGCYGQRFSQGQWIYNNGTILLTSFDSFKQREQTEPSKPTEHAGRKKIKRKSEKEKIEFSFAGFKNTSPPVLPGPNHTVRIYLYKIPLQLKDDVLICTGASKLSEDPKFHRIKNDR